MDKNTIDRLSYIENSGIKTCEFYTNFIGANEATIKSIFALKKIKYMEISIYGHDLESFCNITGRGKEQYGRLVKNLRTLVSLYYQKPSGLNICLSMRTYRSFRFNDGSQNELLENIEKLRQAGVQIGLSSQVDNWGGDIAESDVADIEMDLIDGRYTYKKGPCSLPFDSIQVTAEGIVNACACRDPRGSLFLGDLKLTPLNLIHTPDNEKWIKIIREQEVGKFNEACSSCGFYQSIYDERHAINTEFMTKNDYIVRARNFK